MHVKIGNSYRCHQHECEIQGVSSSGTDSVTLTLLLHDGRKVWLTFTPPKPGTDGAALLPAFIARLEDIIPAPPDEPGECFNPHCELVAGHTGAHARKPRVRR